MYKQVIDANVNRVSEGLRVIEEYVRFVLSDKKTSQTIASFRQQIHQDFPSIELLMSRETATDARAKEDPRPRKSVQDLLLANFKRVTEALRVLEEYTGNQHCNHMRYDIYDLEKDLMLKVAKPIIRKGVYLISDDVDVLKQGIDWDLPIIQLRSKFESKSEILKKASIIKEYAKNTKTIFVLNDFLDIVNALDLDGLHTGQDDIDVTIQRRQLGHQKIIGRSTHSLDQGLIAQKQGADYVSIGPIWKTPSKPDRDPIGFEYLKSSHELQIPFVAIGGVHLDNIPEILPYSPPLIGLIRDFENIPKIQALLS